MSNEERDFYGHPPTIATARAPISDWHSPPTFRNDTDEPRTVYCAIGPVVLQPGDVLVQDGAGEVRINGKAIKAPAA